MSLLAIGLVVNISITPARIQTLLSHQQLVPFSPVVTKPGNTMSYTSSVQAYGTLVRPPEAPRAVLRALRSAALPPEADAEACDEIFTDISRFYVSQLDVYRSTSTCQVGAALRSRMHPNTCFVIV